MLNVCFVYDVCWKPNECLKEVYASVCGYKFELTEVLRFDVQTFQLFELNDNTHAVHSDRSERLLGGMLSLYLLRRVLSGNVIC